MSFSTSHKIIYLNMIEFCAFIMQVFLKRNSAVAMLVYIIPMNEKALCHCAKERESQRD